MEGQSSSNTECASITDNRNALAKISWVGGPLVLFLSVFSDCRMTVDALMDPSLTLPKGEEGCNFDTGTTHSQLTGGLACLVLGCAFTIFLISFNLACLSQSGKLCCAFGSGVLGKAQVAMSLGIIGLVLSVPLFISNIANMAVVIEGCKTLAMLQAGAKAGFGKTSDAMPLQQIVAMAKALESVKAGIGSVAGVLGCMGILSSSYFVAVAPAAIVQVRQIHQRQQGDVTGVTKMQAINSMHDPQQYVSTGQDYNV